VPEKIILYSFAALIGSCIGSFINVVIYRLPKGIFFAQSRSHCPACGVTLKPAELLPVFSWLFLKGRCRSCRAAVPPRYPAVELACAALACLSIFRFGLDWKALAAFGVAAILLAVALIDIDTMEVPDSLHIALMPFAAAAVWLWPNVKLTDRIIGFAAVSVPLFLLTLLVKDAFGGADIKLMAVCGFLLGWQLAILAFSLALLPGGLYAIFLLLKSKENRNRRIPFCPYLCAGIAASLFYGREIIGFYLSLFPYI
jgi:leader peptidase (prepilin peptidase)/N-methyltransferase